jgi:hypothetical protein
VESIGSGAAWVFAGGRMVEGSWSRPDSGSGFELSTEEGDTLEVPAGRVWISFFPSGQTPTWS